MEVWKAVKKFMVILGTLIAILFCTFGILLSFSIEWMFKTWTNLTMDELVFHLTSPLEGTNQGMIQDYFNQCAVPAILVLIALIILLAALRKQRRKYWAAIGIFILMTLIMSAYFMVYTWDNLEVGNYMNNQGKYSTFVDDNYVDPVEVEISFPEQKRNLIYIFLESMETTYSDKKNGGGFEFDCIPELTEFAQSNEDFSGEEEKLNGGYALTGTTWTAGAMFAQTSGIPLTSDAGNNMDTQDSFYANTVTMGDILENAGYSQTLLIGSDGAFGGREKYFTQHGNFDILDYNYAIKRGWIPEDYKVWWGYEDEKLFMFAKETLLELSGQGEPFNLTMLTVDTHFEDGYPCQNCRDEFRDNQYANVMACSSRAVSQFVKWVQEQPFYENTTIVLVGDHPTMDSDFCDDVDKDYERKVYTCYINAAAEIQTNEKRNYTTFDIFPTTLASLGVQIQGERLGLGTNLFSYALTLSERYGLQIEKSELKKKSRLIEELAAFDENKPELKMRKGEMPSATVNAGTYDFTTGLLPVAVTDIVNVGDNMESVLIAVWTKENQEDLQWIQLEQQDDGNYAGVVNVPNFGYVTGIYNIKAYMIDNMGEQYDLGSTVGEVQ